MLILVHIFRFQNNEQILTWQAAYRRRSINFFPQSPTTTLTCPILIEAPIAPYNEIMSLPIFSPNFISSFRTMSYNEVSQ